MDTKDMNASSSATAAAAAASFPPDPPPAVAVRFSASKVALAAGLHEFGDVTDEAVELLYQDRPALLERDAHALGLRVISRDDELREIVDRSGGEAARELRAALKWTRERDKPTRVATAHALAAGVDAVLANAAKRRKLAPEEAAEAAALVREKIRQSVGNRNEALAIQEYEKRTGSQVRLTNENMYVLTYPPPDPRGAQGPTVVADTSLPPMLSQLMAADYTRLDAMARCTTLGSRCGSRRARVNRDGDDEGESSDGRSNGLFSICGMVDGVADALVIAEDGSDEWALTPVVVEVKNRLRALRDPPPLHDVVQMAVYMKMLGVTDGDLVQCLNSGDSSGNDTPPIIAISRVSMSSSPLNGEVLAAAGGDQRGNMTDQSLWTRVVLPRLYALASAIDEIRRNDLQRLSYLNSTRAERLAILRRHCDHL